MKYEAGKMKTPQEILRLILQIEETHTHTTLRSVQDAKET
jgi:hypothetical protein